MSNLLIYNVARMPDFPYDITLMYPTEVHKEKIFQENINKVLLLLKVYIKEDEMLGQSKQILKHLKFESQQNKQMELINDCENLIKSLVDEMNSDIKPYYWRIYKNIDTYDWESNTQIKADYRLLLEK